MKLEVKNETTLYGGKIVACLEKKENNPALQKMLTKLQKGGLNALKNDDELKSFAKGLIETFNRDGYIGNEASENPLSDIGNEIAKTGKVFNQLDALFDVSFVRDAEGNLYLIKCDVSKEEKANQQNLSNQNLPGNFSETIYKTDVGFEIRKLRLENKNFLMYKDGFSRTNAVSAYDFDTRNSLNKIISENVSFVTDDSNTFHFINSSKATQKLKELFSQDELKNCFVVNEDNSIVVERFENEMLSDLWEQIWENGKAVIENNKEKFTDVIFCIKNENVCKDALMHFLMHKAETAYIGKNETGNLINKFDKLFISCPNIKESTSSLYEQTKETALKEKKIKALLRMQAYQDLSPDGIYKDYEKRTPITYSNRDISFGEFVSDVLGGDRNILSITMFSKYLSENISACRAAFIIAKNIEQKFGVKMNIITSSETKKSSQQKIENIFFKKIEQAANVIDEKFADIKDIHDRYWQIERDGGKTEFFITSGELDALKFENDFTNSKPRMDITAETKGEVKEMTVTFVDESGLPEKIKKYFEQTLTKGGVK